MGRKRISGSSNAKYDLANRSAKSQTGKSTGRKRGKKWSAKEAKHQASIGRLQIMKELTDPKIIAILGSDNIYLHNNMIYASMGLQTATKLLKQTLTEKVADTHAKIDSYITYLNNKEKQFYDKAKIIPSWVVMQRYWAAFTSGSNGEGDFQDFFTHLMALRDLGVIVQNIKGEEKQAYTQEMNKAIISARDYMTKHMQNLIRTNPNVQAVEKYLQEAVRANKRDGNRLVITRSISSVAKEMGFVLEDMAEFGARAFTNNGGLNKLADELLQEGLIALEDVFDKNGKRKKGISITTIAQGRKGISAQHQGASDLVINAGGAEVGISAKLSRSYDFGNKDVNSQKVLIGETMSASASTLEEYFLYSNNRSFDISVDEFAYIRYGLANWQQWTRMSDRDEFQKTLKYLIAWDRIIKALLGDGFDAAIKANSNLLPVFITTGTELFRMADTLQKVRNMSAEGIWNIVNANYSLKDVFKNNVRNIESLYDKKKERLAQRRAQVKAGLKPAAMTYPDLKAYVNTQLGELNILRDCKISVSYRIVQDNIKHAY